MTHLRRTVVLAIVALMMVAAGALYAQDTYRIGVLRGPTAVAFAPLIDETPVLEDGRGVEVVTFPTPPNLIAAYLGGEVDAATLPSNAAAQLSGRGAPVQVAATFIWGVLYVVGPAEVTLDELGGEVYSIGRGASPDVVFRYVLEQEGLADEIEVAYGYAQVELSQLLISGRVDAGVLPEPFVTRVLAENEDLGIVADLQERFAEHAESGLPQTTLVVRPGDDATAELVDLLDGSVEAVLADPEASATLVAGLGLGLDEETVRASLPRLNLRVENAAESRSALERYLSILYEFEPASVGGSLPGDTFYGGGE
ncbi:MAG: ABC transporter substrate-binding protein [Spirochaetota bacterium]